MVDFEDYVRKRRKIIEKNLYRSIRLQRERLDAEHEQEQRDKETLAKLRDINDPLPTEF